MPFQVGDKVLVLVAEEYGSMATPSVIDSEPYRFSDNQPLQYPVESFLRGGTRGHSQYTEEELIADTPANRRASRERVAAAKAAAVERRSQREAEMVRLAAQLEALKREDWLDKGSKASRQRAAEGRRLLKDMQARMAEFDAAHPDLQ
jgi:hypothetical protein